MRVIWIDPGETVGYAIARVDGRELIVEHYDNATLKRFAMSLDARLTEDPRAYDLVGYEQYVIRGDAVGLKANVGSTAPTIQLIGMIKLAVWKAQTARKDGFPQLDERTPLSKSGGSGAVKLHATTEIKDAVAEALGGRHDDGHYGDALLHLYGWYHKRYFDSKGHA